MVLAHTILLRIAALDVGDVRLSAEEGNDLLIMAELDRVRVQMGPTQRPAFGSNVDVEGALDVLWNGLSTPDDRSHYLCLEDEHGVVTRRVRWNGAAWKAANP